MNTHDIFRFISKLSVLRLWNIIQLVSSFYVSKWVNKPIQWGKPMTISIEPTTACNLRCPECPSGLRAFTRDTGNLKPAFFESVINQLKSRLTYLIFYFQGEPYINPDFLDMVRYAEQQGIYTITSTNGHFLTDKNAKKTIESGLSRIIISVDGTTQEIYEQYRKEGNLEKVLEGTRTLLRWRKKLGSKTPYVIFQFLVVKPNEHQIEDIKKLTKEMGVDELKLKTAQIYDYKYGNPLIPENEVYSRYQKQENNTYVVKHSLLNHCWKLWHSCVITWDGIVVPCCFDKDAKHSLGDLKIDNFSKIWKNEYYSKFRSDIFKGRDKIDICKNCSEGCSVWK